MMVSDFRYTFTQLLHENERSRVYIAQNQLDRENVLIKVLNKPFASLNDIARFKHEYQIACELKDVQGAAKAIDYLIHENEHCIVFEYFDAKPLKYLIDQGGLGMRTFLEISIKVFAILAEIHKKGIIHKDLNPNNILVNLATHDVKIIDFGIAIKIKSESNSGVLLQQLEGTLAYISPEQTGRMNKNVDFRSDFYSLGATLYQFLTRKLPFHASDSSEIIFQHLTLKPEEPSLHDPKIPSVISAILLKLLEKNPDARYKTAEGVIADLRKCLNMLIQNGKITPFEIGKDDISDAFVLPQKLYGRESECKELIDNFYKTLKGNVELMIIHSEVGMGTSSIVNELYKPLTQFKGHLLSSISSQENKEIPCGIFIDTLKNFIDQLLLESDDKIDFWREKIATLPSLYLEELHTQMPSLQLLTPTIPRQESSLNNSESVLSEALISFFQLLGEERHPLVLFLENFGESDLASQQLLSSLVTSKNSKYLLVIASLLSSSSVTVKASLALIEQRKKIKRLQLIPLKVDAIVHLLTDTMYSNRAFVPVEKQKEIQELAELVLQKTGGIPFYVNDYLTYLHAKGRVYLHRPSGEWTWDCNAIKESEVSLSIADHVLEKFYTLDENTIGIVQIGATQGMEFDLYHISLINNNINHRELIKYLWHAVDAGIISPKNENYKLSYLESSLSSDLLKNIVFAFAHLKVKNAIYESITPLLKEAFNYSFALSWFESYTEEKGSEKHLYTLLNYTNNCTKVLCKHPNALEFAKLNLEAGIRSKNTGAFDTARFYFDFGIQLLPSQSDADDLVNVSFQLYSEKTEALLHMAKLDEAFECVQQSYSFVQKKSDSLRLDLLAMEISLLKHDHNGALALASEALENLGLSFPLEPTKSRIELEKSALRLKLINFNKTLINTLPTLDDENTAYAVRILFRITNAAYLHSEDLYRLVILKLMGITFTKGLHRYSAYGFAAFGVLLSQDEKRYSEAYNWSLSALECLNYQKLTDKSVIVKVYLLIGGYLMHHGDKLRECISLLDKAYLLGIQTGNLFDGSNANEISALLKLFVSTNVHEVQKNFQESLNLAQKIGLGGELEAQIGIQLSEALKGRTTNLSSLESEELSEEHILHLAVNEQDSLLHTYYRSAKLLLSVVAKKFDDAILHHDALRQNKSLLIGEYTLLWMDFLYAVALAQSINKEEFQQNRSSALFKKLLNLEHIFANLSKCSPKNFANKHWLIKAEIFRLEDDVNSAMECYENSMKEAESQEFTLESAIVLERCAEFFHSRGNHIIAKAYFTEAFSKYMQFGAAAKASLMREEHPQYLNTFGFREQSGGLFTTTTTSGSTFFKSTKLNSQDMEAVYKAMDIVNGEIELDRLLTQLLEIIVESTGAQRAFFILYKKEKLVLAAQKLEHQLKPEIGNNEAIDENSALSYSLVNFVFHTKELMIINNLSDAEGFKWSTYVMRNKPMSALCQPILQHGQLRAILYLENNLIPGAFSKQRIELLKVLSTEMAISINHAVMFESLEEMVAERTREVIIQKEIIEEKNKKITSSINYAKRIQEAMLPSYEMLSSYFPDHFTIYIPKDIVSGDFYWFVSRNDIHMIVGADCTGHGVPGALMSMIGINLLNQIVNEINITDPSEILDYLNLGIQDALKQRDGSKTNDGMDLAICKIDMIRRQVTYAGAHIALYHVREGEVDLFVPDKFPVGGSQRMLDEKRKFSNKVKDILPGDIFYISSDGLFDQIGGGDGRKKFMKSRFKEILSANHHLPMDKQKEILMEAFYEWKGEFEQIDDLMVLGFRI